jgi:uncharacterized protein (DUF2336 family)
MLKGVTDLFVGGSGRYSDDQIELFADVIKRLVAELEVSARAELSNSLAPVSDAPISIVKSLALDDEIIVAAPVLSIAKGLGEVDLLEAVKTKGQKHLLAISKRAALPESITDVLVSRGDNEVVRSTVSNNGARFSERGFSILVDRSANDETLAERVGLRKDLPREHLRALIKKASDVVRAKLAAASPEKADEIRRVLAEIAGRLEGSMEQGVRDYRDAEARVGHLHAAGKLDEAKVREMALAARFEDVVVACALLSGVPTEVIGRAMLDDRPDLIMIFAKAAGFSWQTLKLMMVLRTRQSGLALHKLENAHANYQRLNPATAKKVLDKYRARQDPGKTPRVA